MTTAAYKVGTNVRVDANTFVDIDGAAADPDTITARVKQPDDSVTEFVYGTAPTLQRDGVGQYHLDYEVTQAGRHTVQWEGTGVVAVVAELDFYAVWQDVA